MKRPNGNITANDDSYSNIANVKMSALSQPKQCGVFVDDTDMTNHVSFIYYNKGKVLVRSKAKLLPSLDDRI